MTLIASLHQTHCQRIAPNAGLCTAQQTCTSTALRLQTGLALPTVMALSLLSSVLLLACWRNITLSQAWSRSYAERWQLQQAALTALCQAVTAIATPIEQNRNTIRVVFPMDQAQWAQLQNLLPLGGCIQGVCRPLLHLGNRRSDWLGRASMAGNLSTTGEIKLIYWVEVLPGSANTGQVSGAFSYRITALAQHNARGTLSAWQSVWQPRNWPLTGQPVRLANMQSVLELLP